MDKDKAINKVEAVLFASGKSLDESYLKEIVELTPKALKTALESLKKRYEAQDNALFIFNEGTKWKINVKEEYVTLVKKIVAETELERPVLETLAIIAYRSPVLQSEVVKARGEGAYTYITELVEKGFVTKEKFARSFKLKITDKFFNYFDVEGDEDIRDLFKDIKKPEVEIPKKLGELEVVEAESDVEHNKKKREEMQLKIFEVKKDLEKDKEYLDEFDKRLGSLHERVKVSEEAIDNQKANMTVNENKNEEGNEESTKKTEEENNNKDNNYNNDNNDNNNNENDGNNNEYSNDNENKNENEDQTNNDKKLEDKETEELTKEKSEDEKKTNTNDPASLVKKIDKEIEELTKEKSDEE